MVQICNVYGQKYIVQLCTIYIQGFAVQNYITQLKPLLYMT